MATPVNQYELIYIVNSVLGEEQIKDIVQRVDKFIVEHGGEIADDKEVWGQQRLSYPIEKKRNGFYVNLRFTAPGSIVTRLERALEINDNVLRYLTLKMDKKMIRNHAERVKARVQAASAAAEAAAAAAAADAS